MDPAYATTEYVNASGGKMIIHKPIRTKEEEESRMQKIKEATKVFLMEVYR